MKAKTILLIAFILGYADAYAQFDPRTQIQQPSAEAQAFNEFNEIPVDLHTGRVDITIPLYEVTHHDITVPISLSYHGGGIKVTDESGIVGLGWTLNVGGEISRIVRGFPDDLSASGVAGFDKLSFFTMPNTLNDCLGFIELIKQRSPKDRDPTIMLELPNDKEIYLLNIIDKYGTEYDNGRFETSPDNYMFSVQGHSGAFVHQKHKIIAQTNSECSISHPNDMSYIITDADGYTYRFEDVEQHDFHYKIGYGWNMTNWDELPEENYRYFSAWWLSNITSASGEKVHFGYNDIEVVHPVGSLHGYTQTLRRTPHNEFITRHNSYTTFQETPNKTYHKQLQKIETPACLVKFAYQPAGSNTVLPHLSSIQIYAKQDLVHPIETIQFHYSGNQNRSKLTKITKYGANNEEQNYVFTYYPDDYGVKLFDKRVDHWGYFARESTGRFPIKPYFGFDLVIKNNPQYTNRYADNTTAANNMLHTITYPTGNTTELTWEPHSFSRFSQSGQTAYKEDTYSTQSTTQFVSEQSFQLSGKLGNEILSIDKYIPAGKTIQIDFKDYYYLQADGQDCIYDWNNEYIYTQNRRPTVRVKKDDTVVFEKYIHKSTINDIYTIPVTSYAKYTFELLYPREMLKSDGICIFPWELFNRADADVTDFGLVNIDIGSEQTIAPPADVMNVGGVRIKQIAYKDGTQPLLTKVYDYVLPNNTSSGVLAYPPRYSSVIPSAYSVILTPVNSKYPEARITETPNMLTLRSNGLPFTLNGGGHIEYERVIESIVETAGKNVANGNPMQQIIYTYQTGAEPGCADLDETHGNTFIPTDMLQLTSMNHHRGHLTSKTEYADEYKTTNYYYNIAEDNSIDTMTGSLYTVADFTEAFLKNYIYQGHFFHVYKDVFLVKYRVIPYNKRIAAIRTTGDKSNSYEAYTYQSNTYSPCLNANMPATKCWIDSEGDTIQQHYTYLNANSNKLTSCVTVKQGKVIDAYRYVYDNKQRILAKYIAPLNVNSLPASSSYNITNLAALQTESYMYNDSNRLVEFTDPVANLSTVYLWSYRNMYPVAEIQNATYDMVIESLGMDNINRLATTFTPDMEMVNNLRSLLPDAMVSTMTYQPLVGMKSFTDAKGNTVYYDYDDFGQVKEIYLMHNGQKEILQHIDYHWSH